MPSIAQSLQEALQLHQSGQLADAERIYRSIIRIDPRQPDALHLLGVAQQQRGNPRAAADYIGRAVALNPHAAVFHANLAAAYKSLGSLEAAKECLETAVRIDPGFADGHYNLGTVLRDLRRFDEAAAALRRAVRLDAKHADAWNNLGLVLAATQERSLAGECFAHAVRLRPNFVAARTNLASWFREVGDPVAAEREFRAAIGLAPDDSSLLNNLGVALKDQGRFEEALAEFDRVLELDSEHVESHVNRAFLLGLFGELAASWDESEWRFRATPLERTFDKPRWHGEPLAGRSILIHLEQGIGDQVMVSSCVSEIAAQAGHCTLECDPRLVPLFRRSFPAVHVVAEDTATLAVPHDVQIPVGSLPRFVRPSLESFPAPMPFLIPDADDARQWRKRYHALPGRLTVGISWRGGADAELRRARSIPLDGWGPVLSQSGVNFVTLQYGDHRDECRTAERLFGTTIHNWDDADPLTDLDGFTAQISALDLVISVDNSTVHFAGGLGVRSWVLLPFVPDWRWMLDRGDSPWYGSVRLFRQPQPGDWDSVLTSVRNELSQRMA